jgi:hypothetical protein
VTNAQIQRKGVVEQRLLANEEYETAMAHGAPLPFPILYDWDYIADPSKRLEQLREQEKTAKLTDKGWSTLPREEKHYGELMEDNKEHGVSVSSIVTIDSVTDTVSGPLQSCSSTFGLCLWLCHRCWCSRCEAIY